jgi:hypothetical protein
MCFFSSGLTRSFAISVTASAESGSSCVAFTLHVAHRALGYGWRLHLWLGDGGCNGLYLPGLGARAYRTAGPYTP